MNIEELECDLSDALQNDDRSVLKKWIYLCREFRTWVAARIEEELLYEQECIRKRSANDRKISELQREIDKVKSDTEATLLEQKITDKKISNVIKSQERLKDELEKIKIQRDTLSLEMVDLELEMETRKRNKILQWDAIKRACHIYKANLKIHMSLQEEKDCEEVKVSFFTHSAATKNQYFVRLLCCDGHWKVEQIEPMLKREHYNNLPIVTDPSGNPKVSDITLLLCQVRSIFLKYYMKVGKK